MNEAVLVAVISGICTLIGSLAGVVAAANLTNYRLKQLELKVEKHNHVVERTFKLEGAVIELQHDVKDLRGYHRPC